ncbi:adenylate/guanylate cyclase domain-containing protein [uncultured Ruegeria sp.]|uniref:adenylate/guanylate cyclase domain-containing protein n=2 Tax=uncultured Ruegeria sp. TaxID=259304 RepID=UPI002632E982|nr:adenylate/guanylate cyclase domain-containing protein [uncultured Ruegeria sp.]
MHQMGAFFSRSINVSAKVIALSSLTGAVIGAVRASPDTLWSDIWTGALTGFVISLCCLLAEYQVFSNPKRRMTRRLRPILLMILRGAAYSLFIVFGLLVPDMLTETDQPWKGPAFAGLFAISAAIAFAFSIGIEVTRLLGKEATVALFTGRYTKARLEQRVILFADVIGSTALAETIGQLRFHDFLRDVALDLADAVEMTRGDVHKYVGDSVIVTWKLSNGLANATCLRCALEMHRILASRAEFYKKRYSAAARIRVAIHCGEVAAGEIGDWKKEIALLGDPMNTAARIEGAAKMFNADIVLSNDVVCQLPIEHHQRLTRLPSFKAPGKQDELSLWSADFYS